MSRTFRLGAFIIATLLIFAAGIFWIGGNQFLFNSTYRLNADFQNVGGLSDGAEVRVGEIHEGTVRRIDLPRRPTDKVRVEMGLKGATREVIRKDSVAAIRSEGLVGDRYVEISFGSDQGPKVNAGDTIQSEPPLQISDLMKRTSTILNSAEEAMQSVDETASNLRAISSKINQGKGTMGALINDRDIYQHASAAATALQEDMEALKHNFLLRGFFNKRGYEDSTNLKKHEISQLPARPVVKQFAYDGNKLFDKPETAKLKKGKMLNDAGEYLESTPFGLVVIAAYTDMKGDTEKIRKLTEARAMVVRDRLVQNFKVDDTRIKTIGFWKIRGRGQWRESGYSGVSGGNECAGDATAIVDQAVVVSLGPLHPLRIPPKPLEIIVRARFFRKDVDEVISVIDQHPLGVLVAFHARWILASRLELQLDLVGDGLDLTGVRAAANHEIVGERGHFAQVEYGDIASLFGFGGVDGS